MMPTTMQQIEDFGRRIGEEFHPRRVVLFGSHARDAATVERLSDELDHTAPVQVPYLDEDIQDLAGEIKPALLVRVQPVIGHRFRCHSG